jgi:RNA polymerase sigma-70 factor (ECF subfamily)
MFLLDRDQHGVDASALHDRAERDAFLREALDQLSADDRELLALRYDAEQSFRDIALALGIDEAAARKRVGRALVRLRGKLRAA